MLINSNAVKGFKLHGRDGEIGKVKEFYFDDHHWAIRYLIADTGSWLTGRAVLISPHAITEVSCDEQFIGVSLTKKEIEDSPSINSDKPVSQQFEDSYYGYYGWPAYWSGPYLWGFDPHIIHERDKNEPTTPEQRSWDHHLRSTHDVSGRHVQANDGAIGHVEDFLIDDETWAIRYLIVDTKNLWPGKHVLLSPQWVKRLS